MKEIQYDTDEPVAALATAWSESALAVIRTSGTGSVELFAEVFSSPSVIRNSKGFTLHYGYITDPENGRKLDEVTAAVYRSPRSYTGQDSVEVFCHGSLPGIESILELLRKNGFRQAAPGEFTMRAFMNGKMDLSQAEAVAEIVQSKSRQAHTLSLNRLSGGVLAKIDSIKADILNIMSIIEVQLDYPEDEIGGDAVISPDPVFRAEKAVTELVSTYRVGKMFRDGVSVALAGGTNAGKSSLFNLFLKEDRSIVSEIKGTTRDYIESWITISGIPVRLYDTAGLRDAEHPVEAEGVRRSGEIISNSSLVIYVIDGETGLTEEDSRMVAGPENDSGYIYVWNKTDVSDNMLPDRAIGVSAVTGEGFSDLEKAIRDRLTGLEVSGVEVMIDSLRQKELLDRAASSLSAAGVSLREGISLDAVAVDMKDALDALGELTGEVTSADILNNIFSGFCVGK